MSEVLKMLLTDLHTISLQDDHEVTEGDLAIEVAVCLVEDLLQRLLSLPGHVLLDHAGHGHGYFSDFLNVSDSNITSQPQTASRHLSSGVSQAVHLDQVSNAVSENY